MKRQSKGLHAVTVGLVMIIGSAFLHKSGADRAGPAFGYFWLAGLPLASMGIIDQFRGKK